MAILCRDLKLLFIMVPGTGCSVLGNVLTGQFGGEYVPGRDILEHGRVVHPSKHNNVGRILRDGLLTQSDLRELVVVANIRNPFDRLVTYYQRLAGDWVDYSLGVQGRELERHRHEMSDEEYSEQCEALELRSSRQKRRKSIVKRVGFNSWLLITLARKSARRGELGRFLFPMLEGVQFGLRNEMLEESVNMLFGMMGIDGTVSIPRQNLTQGKLHYTTYWNRTARGALSALGRQDLERFGYAFDDFDRSTPVVDLQRNARQPIDGEPVTH